MRGRWVLMRRAAPRDDNDLGLGGKKGQKEITPERLQCFLLFSLISPTIKLLINSPVHGEITQRPSWLQRRQLSISKWGKCQSAHLPFFSFSISLLQIFSWAPADSDARWDANHSSFNSLYFQKYQKYMLCSVFYNTENHLFLLNTSPYVHIHSI